MDRLSHRILDNGLSVIHNGGKKTKGGIPMKSDRVMSVLMVLLEGKRMRAQDLADRLEVSVRTVYRDIDTLCAAGIPVRSIGGAKGGVELMPGYRLDGRLFSPEEHSALLAGLSNLSAMLGTDALARTLSKLRGILPDAQTGAIERRAAQIVIDPEPWLGDGRTKQTLEIVETALEARRLLAFAYLDRFGNRSERAVEPYRLVLKGDQWYFQGYCLLRNDYRLFRLSRMLDVRMREESFLPREAPQPELDTGEIVASLRAEITLRVHASAVDRVLEYCAFDRFTPDGDEYYLVRFPFIDREYYYDRLLSFGDRCECVAPARVREKLRQRIRRLAEMYQ